MQQKANIRKDFDQQVVFYSLFREEGINDNFRGGLWCSLLDIYSLKMGHHSAFFAKLSEIENKQLETIIDNDTIADRSDLLVNKANNEYLKPDPQKIRKVILAYGNMDMELGYNQGYNFLITLMLHYIDDEEDVFWMLHKIMFELNWR
jgi:hypothetical protein